MDGWSPWWSSWLSLYTAWCRCPGGREAHLQQCGGQFAQPFAELCGCQRCCFQTRRWCSRSGCSPQCSVEGSEDAGARSKLPQPSQEEEALMCLLQHCVCVSRPCEILGDVNAEELKLFTRSNRCLVDGDGCVFSALSPEIHHQLLGLVDVEWEVVLLAPFSQGTHLLSVGRLIVVGDQAYHRCVIGKFDDDVGAVCVAVQSCVYRQYRSGLRTQPCGGTSVEDQGRWGVVAHSDHLTSACQESPGSSCTEICSVPESGASQPVWQALWC